MKSFYILKCNSMNSSMSMLTNESRNCVESIGYGLLSDYLNFNGEI